MIHPYLLRDSGFEGPWTSLAWLNSPGAVYEPLTCAAVLILSISSISPRLSFHQSLSLVLLCKLVKMGFNFRGLTSAALVSKSNANADAAEKDIADVPASVAGHTSIDAPRPGPDEKIGAPHSETDSDDELNKVDTHAEPGVQNVQAMTHVWTKKSLILAYIS